MHFLGEDVGGKRYNQGDRAAGHHGGHQPGDQRRDPAHGDAHQHRNRSPHEELEDDVGPYPAAGDGRRHGSLEDDDSGGIIEEALALQDRNEPPRHMHPAGHGLHGHGVRRSHHGAQGDGGGDPDSRDHEPGRPGDCCRGYHHQGHGEHDQRAPADPEHGPGTALGRREQQRRQADGQDQLR
ncbi:hypothetical protein D9M72_446990 [compost metagenome]